MVDGVTLFGLFLTVPPVFVVRSSLGYFSVIWNLYINIYLYSDISMGKILNISYLNENRLNL